MPPESNAMLQALYSRDPQSVTAHLERVKEVGAEKFMASYYVGYGHKSIGDCGTTTLFIEQVSLLAAKAIQDWPLYNGQEASTRYLNMSEQEVLNPLKSKEGASIQKIWMKLYEEILEELVPYLKDRFPKREDEKDTTYEKAIKAKAFDIARGFLPAGVTTLLSWHTNLRQAHDHLLSLKHHPLSEIRSIAADVRGALQEKYKSSFLHKEYESQEKYISDSTKITTFFDNPEIKSFRAKSNLDLTSLKKYKKILQSRPEKTELPHQFRKFGTMRFTFPLDFGSFRDLQRHRSGVVAMPILSTKYGFLPWYLEQLPEKLQNKAKKVIAEQKKRIALLKGSREEKQYYVAIGYVITCEVTMPLPAAVYLAELRSAQTVHPTLRIVAQRIGKSIEKTIPGIKMHCDYSADAWSVKRGTQDIVRKH